MKPGSSGNDAGTGAESHLRPRVLLEESFRLRRSLALRLTLWMVIAVTGLVATHSLILSKSTGGERESWLVLAAGIGAILITFVGVGLLSYLHVERPLHRLVQAIERLEGGDLTARASLEGTEELRYLAEAFNRMAGEIEVAHQRQREVISQQGLEIERSRMQIAHQEKMAAIGLLAAGVAHEIGNPLTAISSIAQLLRHRSQDEAVRKQIDLILTHIERISKIVRQMSDFSRPPSLESAPTDLNDVLRTALQLAQYDRRSRDVEVVQDLAPRLPRVTLVADQIFQVFLNLLLNALDAMPHGGRLRLTSRTEAHRVVIEIEDTGTGIPEEIHDRIFEPFFTTKDVGKGTGLGLSVSWGIVQSLGGDIEVRSIPGQGSTFTVFIPQAGLVPAKESR